MVTNMTPTSAKKKKKNDMHFRVWIKPERYEDATFSTKENI